MCSCALTAWRSAACADHHRYSHPADALCARRAAGYLAAISAATIRNYLASSRWTWATPTTDHSDHRPLNKRTSHQASSWRYAASRRLSVVNQKVAPLACSTGRSRAIAGAAAQSAYSAALMLYAWKDDEKLKRNRVPASFEPPRHHFTVMLPARHEEQVIQQTIQRTVELNYPRELVQILVVIEAGDGGTIAEVRAKQAELAAQGITRVRLITFDDPPINKPHAERGAADAGRRCDHNLRRRGLKPHPDILQVVNTVMLREGSEVVQCGIQLMNYADRWFSVLSVLSICSGLEPHAPPRPGGDGAAGRQHRVYDPRAADRAGGWDETCPTEDAHIGIRLCADGGMRASGYLRRRLCDARAYPAIRRPVRQAAHALEPGLLEHPGQARLAAPRLCRSGCWRCTRWPSRSSRL